MALQQDHPLLCRRAAVSPPLRPESDPGQAGDWKAVSKPGLWPIPGKGTPGMKPGVFPGSRPVFRAQGKAVARSCQE